MNEWRTHDLKVARHCVDNHYKLTGDVPATYDNLARLLRECPESEPMLKMGIHDIVNTLYSLCPETDKETHDQDHRDTLREAFDGLPIKDRRTPRETNDGEYLVVTDEEAEELWDEYLESYLDDCVEGSDSVYFDRESWKEDARVDGRGHCLGRYDGGEEEVEIEWDGAKENYFIYRQS